ncbi:2-phosphoxylose phosphatase 1 [Smittium culicis]|uniref:2-phosphoxylose phosphatase 1 n=1 Tax=Smittium culicis TaxID=133412 RepID=A0A1R1YA72_9FUNG|nr:2-phosphoxylose phosphatase 1 [Smittium culicis]
MKSNKILKIFFVLNSTTSLSINSRNQYSRRSSFTDSYNGVYNSLEENSEIYNSCQAKFIDADTYNPLENSELISVQMIMRHGDRAPTFFNENDGQIYNFCNLSKYNPLLRPISTNMVNSTVDNIAEGTLVVIPSNNTCSPGGLTEKGALASLDLGKSTRSIYVDKLGFLSPTLKNSDQIKVRVSSSG